MSKINCSKCQDSGKSINKDGAESFCPCLYGRYLRNQIEIRKNAKDPIHERVEFRKLMTKLDIELKKRWDR